MSAGHTKTAIEDAILAALRPLSLQAGGYIRVLGPYRGEPEPGGLVGEALQMPAVLVSHATSTYAKGPYLHAKETLGFNVVAVCRSGSSPDVFGVLEDVRGILCGSRLGLEISPLALLRETALRRGRDTEIYAALYTLTQDVELTAQTA